MRAFIVLAVLAVARADVSGYTYGTGSNGGYAAEGLGGISLGNGGLGGGSSGIGSHVESSLGGSSLGGNGGGDYAAHQNVPTETEFNKEFFTFSAPEADFEDGKSFHELTNSHKKNLRVVFIRAPENNGLAEAAVNLAKSAVDSKTAIYVLTKQGDISDLANKLQAINNNHGSKPEVHFVKYRTPEDAAHAQRAIQQEYNRLGGTSQSYNGGVGPVLNYASKAPARSDTSGGSSGSFEGGAVPANGYIPPTAASLAGPSATYLPIVKF